VFDFVTLGEHLVQVRSHDEQIGREQLGPMAAYGMVSERMDAIAYLIGAQGAYDMEAAWISERLLNLSAQRSHYAQLIEPQLGVIRSVRLSLAIEDVESVTAVTDRLLLVDQYEWGDAVMNRIVERFGEQSGVGTPADSRDAIDELESLRLSGASHLVIGWPSFWWLDFYTGLRRHLTSRYRLALSTSRVVVYDLHTQPEDKE
jgi:hypothetical protein